MTQSTIFTANGRPQKTATIRVKAFRAGGILNAGYLTAELLSFILILRNGPNFGVMLWFDLARNSEARACPHLPDVRGGLSGTALYQHQRGVYS